MFVNEQSMILPVVVASVTALKFLISIVNVTDFVKLVETVHVRADERASQLLTVPVENDPEVGVTRI